MEFECLWIWKSDAFGYEKCKFLIFKLSQGIWISMYSSFHIKEISLLILDTLKVSLIDKISNLFHLSKENQSLLTKHPSASSISWPVLHVDLHLAFCPAKLILLPQMFLKRPSLTSKLYSAHVYFQSSFFSLAMFTMISSLPTRWRRMQDSPPVTWQRLLRMPLYSLV